MIPRAPASVSSPRESARPRTGVSDSFKAHLVFAVGVELYACPIEAIDYVLRQVDAPLRPSTAGAPPWEAGRLLTPGGELPVVSLSQFWKLSDARKQSGREALLVVRLPGQAFALGVDACLTVVSTLPAETIQFRLPPALLGTRGAALECAFYFQKSLLVTLQLGRLFPSEFQNLGAAGTSHPAPL